MTNNIIDSGIYVPGYGDGQPGRFTLPGSGYAVPAGLEAVLEYNGLLLNVRQNVDRYKIISIDGLSDADVRDTRDVNTDDDGETPYNSFYGGRSIVIAGSIQTYSIAKLRDMQEALKTAFSDIRNEYPLHFRTGDFTKDHVIYCKKVSPIAGSEQQANLQARRDFQITLRASNPRFLSYYQNFIDLSPNPTTVAIPLATSINRGNYYSQPIFRIYGPSSGVSFTNDATTETFSFGSVPFADYYEFNTAKRTLKNSLGDNKWNLLMDDSDYIRFISGSNPLFYEGDASRVQIWWNDSWI